MDSRFDDKNKEYVIKDMYPKRPWLNYAWNDTHVSCYNQFGFGMSRYSDENGFVRSILSDTDNRLIWIKDERTGEYYAANRNYDGIPFDVFETRVGMGYSNIISQYHSIKTELKLFVPSTGYRELWEVKVTNTGEEEREISLYAYADIDMSITIHDAYTSAVYDGELNGIYASHNAYMSPTKLSGVYFASDREISAFETTNRRFKGIYSDISRPVGIKEAKLSCGSTCFENKITAVLQFKLKLKPKSREKLLFVLGASENADEAREIRRTLLKEDIFNKEYDTLIREINKFQDNVIVKTPDAEINSRVNIWLKRQLEFGKQWGRLCKGFRDIMQDIASFVSLDSHNARKRIVYALQYQREDGNPLRAWEPLMMQEYADGAAWMIYTVNTYLKETGDFSILDERVPYFNSDVQETVLCHCLRGINYLQNTLGEHGLCLWREGDWNDSLNGCGVQGRGESVWLSEATIKAALDMIDILDVLGMDNEACTIRAKADKMKEDIYAYGWDKDHFIYGINDCGERIGSYDSDEGQIFLNPQTWAIISGIIQGDNARKLMELVERKLGCDFGYVQQWPSYSKGSDAIGRSSYFMPGCYENGSVYNHGVAFKVVADTLINDGNGALETLNKILPTNPKNSSEHSGVEPYAMSNMYLGPECESRCGESPSSWITGTCGWLFRGVVEFILGVRADFDGLRIVPNIPDAWDSVRVKRVYRGCEYQITIDGVKSGDAFTVTVDGKELDGNLIPIYNDNKQHKVTVKKTD
ncbi:MAG: hypothetical protein IJT23_00725 [Clostridia bacterium]|nr:hypothetical protein [Clostridia bacterium]